MCDEKFLEQNETMAKFIGVFCDDKHKERAKKIGTLPLKNGAKFLKNLDYHLCSECEELLLYANERLNNCKQDPKPKCRKCKNPCYEKEKWKYMAKIMRSSGMKLGFIKIKEVIFK